MRTSKKTLGALTVVVTSALALTSCGGGVVGGGSGNGGDDETFSWRLVTHQIPGTPRYQETVVPFAEYIEEESDGRLSVEIFGADDLFPTDETFEAVSNGTVDAAAIYAGFWSGRDEVFNLQPGVPGDPITDYEDVLVRNEAINPIMEEAYSDYGITFLGAFDYAPPEILMSTVEVNSVEDFNGLNIRAAGSAASFYNALGASVVTVSAPEIYTALQLGTVDAAEFNDFLVNGEMGLDEVTDYVIEPAIHVGGNSDKDLIVNPDSWDALPEDLQAIVEDARDHVMEISGGSYAEANEEAREEWIAEGVEIIELPESEVEEMREVAAEWLLGVQDSSEYAERYVEAYAEVLHDLGYEEYAETLGYSG